DSRYAERVEMYDLSSLCTENGLTASGGSCDPQPFANIVMRLLFGQWPRLAAKHDPLSQLPEFRQLEFLFEFRLSGKNNLKKFLCRGFKMCRHPTLFEHWTSKILVFVNDQDGRFTG